MLNFLLILHIAGAVAVGIGVLSACKRLLAHATPNKLSHSAQTLGLLTCYQLCSGALLWLAAGSGSVGALCSKLAVYLAVVSVVEVALLGRIRQQRTTLAPAAIAVPVSAGVIFVALVAILG